MYACMHACIICNIDLTNHEVVESDEEVCRRDYSFVKPGTQPAVIMINNSQKNMDKSSTILLCVLQLNTSLLMHKHSIGQHNQTIVQIDSGRSGCSEIDYVFLAMPFAARYQLPR